MASLPSNHIIKTLLENNHADNAYLYYFSLEHITFKQYLKIKSSIVNTNNCLNGTFLLFDSLNNKFFPGSRLIDFFPNWFSFHKANYISKESKSSHLWNLSKIVFEVLSNVNLVIVILDASIKNNIATSITHIYSYSNPVKKTLHQAINVNMTEVELFTIRYGISQAIQIPDILHIIIITDSIHVD